MSTAVANISIDLLQRVSRGDEQAFRELFHAWSDPLHTYICRITYSHELAEEIVQDIFLQIWTTRETLASVRNFPTYLFVISRNHALNALKKALREKKRQQAWEALNAQEVDDNTNLEPQLGLIEMAISQLPPQQQKVWILCRRQGKKYQEVAEEMSISRETVKKYLQYANQSILEYVTVRMDVCLLLLLFLLS